MNLREEEGELPERPIVNLSPEVWEELIRSGFAAGLLSSSMAYLQEVMAWICERALDLEENDHPSTFGDSEGNLVFIFNMWHAEENRNVSWSFTFELLDERASYYDVKRVERMD